MEPSPNESGPVSPTFTPRRSDVCRVCAPVCLLGCLLLAGQPALAAGASPPGFEVKSYRLAGATLPSTNGLDLIFSQHVGTNVGPSEIGSAAAEVQSEFISQGQTNISLSVSLNRITNGVVTLNVFRTAVPQVLVDGKRWTNGVEGNMVAARQPASKATNPAAATTKKDTGPRFTVRAYEIRGDTLLSTNTLMRILVPFTGTNVSIGDIMKAASDLQMEYRDRGFPTVSVTIPQQQLTNGIVHIRVFQGKLS
ncbi:MAG: POTRA domain-containing protein, partial [Limisphaerales bacterium]